MPGYSRLADFRKSPKQKQNEPIDENTTFSNFPKAKDPRTHCQRLCRMRQNSKNRPTTNPPKNQNVWKPQTKTEPQQPEKPQQPKKPCPRKEAASPHCLLRARNVYSADRLLAAGRKGSYREGGDGAKRRQWGAGESLVPCGGGAPGAAAVVPLAPALL